MSYETRCRRSRTALLVSLLAGMLVPAPASADGAPQQLLGTWHNVESDGGRATIEAAVDRGTEPMGFLKERIARGRLLDNNPPIPKLRIREHGDAIEVRFADSHRYKAPPGGNAVESEGPDGEDVRVAHRLQDGVLIQKVSAGSSGGSTMVFRPRDGGDRLAVTMTIRSKHLPQPIRYELKFERAGS